MQNLAENSRGPWARGALGGRALRLQSDERLVELTRAGSELAYGALVERYRGPLIGYCRRLVGTQRAEDVVQQAFTTTLASMRASDRPVAIRPWLFTVAHNHAVNVLKRKGSDHEPLDLDTDGVPQPSDRVEQRERFRAVVAELRRLPERQRSALVLRELEGRSYEEIASELNATPQVVRALLHRARTRLRDVCGAVVPMPVLRCWALGARHAGGEPAAEVAVGAGAGAGLAKAGAVLLASGVMVAGGVAGPGPSQRDGRGTAGSAEARAAAPTPDPATAARGPAPDRAHGVRHEVDGRNHDGRGDPAEHSGEHRGGDDGGDTRGRGEDGRDGGEDGRDRGQDGLDRGEDGPDSDGESSGRDDEQPGGHEPEGEGEGQGEASGGSAREHGAEPAEVRSGGSRPGSSDSGSEPELEPAEPHDG